MARGLAFNGTTTRLVHTTQSGFNVAALTILVWARANGAGESGGIILTADEAANSFLLFNQSGTNGTWRFRYNHSSVLGQWSFPITASQYNAVSLTYDRSDNANVPAVRSNFAAISVTEVNAPNGTATAPNTGYAIGNVAGATRTWNGAIAHLQFHPTILSDADCDKALRYPGSVRTAGAFWWPLRHGTDNSVYTVSGGVWVAGSAPSITDGADFTTSRPGCSWINYAGTHGRRRALKVA